MEHSKLVSIIIITYNSSEYVLETLDSALGQSYTNIEIIITDDCSTDNTVELCRKWIEDHKSIGKTITLIEAEKNTGVSGNCNRGVNASKGEWIKLIAGDDMLAPNAIEYYINFVNQNPEVRHLVANAVHFTNKLTEDDLKKPDIISSYLFNNKMTAKRQYSVITKRFFGSGPTYFVHAASLKSIGGYDERFPMQEDYPLFIKMIGAGYKMMFLDKVTVYKRMVPTSIQYDRDRYAIFSKHEVRVISEYKYLYRKEALSGLWLFFYKYSISLQQAIISSGNTMKSFRCRVLRFLYTTTDPFVWYSRYITFLNNRYQRQHR